MHRYIQGLVLSDEKFETTKSNDIEKLLGSKKGNPSPANSMQSGIPDDLRAAINVGTLLSFVDGINPQQRDDVLFSTQLAQRAASGAFDRFTQTQAWYNKYIEVLENVGWAVEQFAFASYVQSDGELRMDKAAVAIIAAIAMQNQLAVLEQSLKALEALSEDDNAMRLFDFHTSLETSGNFQIGAVQTAGNGTLSLAMGGFYFRSADARRRFLFVAWGKQRVDFWTGAQKMTLNGALYARCREQVREKLGEHALGFIRGLDLK